MATFTLASRAVACPSKANVESRKPCVINSAPRAGCPPIKGRRLIISQATQDPTLQFTEDERRWNSQVREGRVRNVTPKDAGELLKDGWVLLDVRPPEEVAKVKVEGAVHVPVFVEDKEASIGTLIKKATAFGMGGWWLGGTHMVPNPQFMGEVQAQIPKDAKVVVACQKGLRSLAACEALSRAGYGQLAWINGGFDTTKAGDLPTKDGADIRLAGIGGLSEFLGWTTAQREASQQMGAFGGWENILKWAAVVLAIDLTWFGVELFQAWQRNQ